ncbi:hypothetical protein L1049_017050 [Liquidambar formosana]|uniref:Major pollen allergen Ole e 6-like n=1 Tax=Liquidambar formosana TaxID=63359 RepID=A0AAP0S096_LIQFO
MANKVAALLALCLVLVASVQLRETEATEATNFASCFTSCYDECKAEGYGFTHCEMKCDTDCGNQENRGKIHVI